MSEWSLRETEQGHWMLYHCGNARGELTINQGRAFVGWFPVGPATLEESKILIEGLGILIKKGEEIEKTNTTKPKAEVKRLADCDGESSRRRGRREGVHRRHASR